MRYPPVKNNITDAQRNFIGSENSGTQGLSTSIDAGLLSPSFVAMNPGASGPFASPGFPQLHAAGCGFCAGVSFAAGR
jgi:hypothetical protein